MEQSAKLRCTDDHYIICRENSRPGIATVSVYRAPGSNDLRLPNGWQSRLPTLSLRRADSSSDSLGPFALRIVHKAPHRLCPPRRELFAPPSLHHPFEFEQLGVEVVERAVFFYGGGGRIAW